MTGRFDVVVVAYASRDTIEHCIERVAALPGVGNLVVVDHGTDGTADIAEVLGAQVYRDPGNPGFGAGQNRGVAATIAPYVLLLNPDTEWWVGTLADYVAVARAHPRAGIVGPMIRNLDGTVYPSGRPLPSVVDAVGHGFVGPIMPDNRFTRRYHMEGWDRTTEREVDWVSGACMLLPRKVFEDVGMLDEAFPLFAEELDMATRLRDAGWSVLYTPDVEVLHALGVSRGRSRRMSVMHSTSVYRYYRKHRAAGWRKLTLPFAWTALRARAEIAWLMERFTG